MTQDHSGQIAEFEGRQATQPKPAEGARDGGPPEAEQGVASGLSSQEPAEGADEAASRNEGSPQG